MRKKIGPLKSFFHFCSNTPFDPILSLKYKVATPEIEKKQNKLTCESNPSEKCEQNINKIKQKEYFTLKTQILTISTFFYKH